MNGSKAADSDPVWHALPVEALLRHFELDPGRGLDADALRRSQAAHGPNELPAPSPQPLWRSFARQFKSPLIYILFVAALLALALGHPADAGVILAVVLVNVLIGSVHDGRAERSMAALRRLATLRVRVLRRGAELLVEARELVPGDTVLLSAGDAVAADARLVDQAQLQVAEPALTGESVPVSKSVAAMPEATGLADRHCMVYSGTHVTAGRARAVVVATGVHTELGRIAGLTEGAEEPQTPLELRLAQFGRALVVSALGLFVLVLLLGLWREMPLAEVLMVAISQMVSMVPEGLPVAMTIALAVGMQRMAARGAIVRRLSAVETLGSTSVICCGKTGTLTRNEMTAVALWLPGGREIAVGGTGNLPEGALVEGGRPAQADDPALRGLLLAAALCNDAELLPPDGERSAWKVLGDPTEAALLVLARKAGIDIDALRRDAPREAELPFDSDNKLMATRHAAAGAARRVWIKGAPEAVLRLCAAEGGAALHAARDAAEAMATQALRVLAFATIDDDALDAAAGFDALAGRARLLGLVGQIDPPREEVRLSVAECRAAGIRPIMVTGDHKLTGLAIARELGIACDAAQEGAGGGAYRAVDGPELERMGEAELRDELPRIAVFARVQPAQKLRIVQALQSRGEVVALTGDGVNDAPALARADVGVAMGITGTEVAKSAARIVVTDDRFTTIVGAVQQGRVVYANLKKVILYLLATSLAEVLVLLLALVGGFPLPLAAVQILWINIVTEGTVTVNLVMDPPDGDEMRRAPVPRDDRLLDAGMLRRVALMAPLIAGVTFGWFAWRSGQGVAPEIVRTETFTVLAMCQWFNVLNCQSAIASALGARILHNRWLLGGLTLSVLLQALVLYAPPMNTLFHTVPLPSASLLPLLGLASVVLWAEEARKLWLRTLSRRRSGSVLRESATTTPSEPRQADPHGIHGALHGIGPTARRRAVTPGGHSIRSSLTGLVTACLAPALLVSGYLVHDNYAQQLGRLERDALLHARSLVAAVDREFSGVVAGLRVLSTSPDLAADDLRSFHGRARDALAFQIVDNYVMTDRQGRQRVNTVRDFAEPLPETGTPPELQRVFETGNPVVTGMFIGPVTGKPVIAIGVPVFRGGQVVYSLNVGLSPRRIAEVLQRRAIPGHWVAAVLDGTGTIVARTRDPETFVGRKATPDVMELVHAGQVEAVITSRSLEGIPTYAGLARSSVSDWSVVVGAPRSAVEAGLRRSIAWLIGGAAAAFAVGLWVAAALSSRISSSIRGLVEPALSLGSGNPQDRLPPSRLTETEAVSSAIVHAGRMLNDARRQARHDPLTGLPNRLLFDELAGNRLSEARRHGSSLATLAVDLDGFKAVNDTHGHEVGDAVLKAAAARISGLLRESDVVARLGGDEFVVLLGDARLADAQHVGGKLIAALSAPYPGVVPPVSCSVGIAMHPQHGHTIAELRLHADQALYEAKRSGKRRACVYRRAAD